MYGLKEMHKYLITYENKVSGYTSAGFIINIKENKQYNETTQVISSRETITRLYVKQFCLKIKKYLIPFICGYRYSTWDFKSYEEDIAKASSQTTSRPNIQDPQLSDGSFEQNLSSQSRSSKPSSHPSSQISSNNNQILRKGCQMNLRTEFFE